MDLVFWSDAELHQSILRFSILGTFKMCSVGELWIFSNQSFVFKVFSARSWRTWVTYLCQDKAVDA